MRTLDGILIHLGWRHSVNSARFFTCFNPELSTYSKNTFQKYSSNIKMNDGREVRTQSQSLTQT